MNYETWKANKDRPVWVRGHREELDALTGEDADRVPDSVAAVPDWVRRYDAVVSRELNDAAEVADES
jgi:hypothetical protein